MSSEINDDFYNSKTKLYEVRVKFLKLNKIQVGLCPEGPSNPYTWWKLEIIEG